MDTRLLFRRSSPGFGSVRNDNAAMKRGADGSIIAAPIWIAFSRRALENLRSNNSLRRNQHLRINPSLLGKGVEQIVQIDKVTGKLATEFTPPELVENRTLPRSLSANCGTWTRMTYAERTIELIATPSPINWELSVVAWVKKNSWNATSTGSDRD